ncbi:hypothetical protein GCM10011575_09730 [Microlunatus endophyticus]|uniref:Uncharacterized protein n=1 Tax=Microlunatus endophyticus TaxID=1716077 RepID=A0A917S3R8_9ACTN|nr:hypothetical protein GCM10011575_09730 [Microlunatus endophyticus]
MIIDPEHARRFRKTGSLEMPKQGVDGEGPRSRRTTHGVADADDRVDETARQQNFMIIVFVIRG